MGIKLNTALGGSITLEPTNTANNVTVNLPVIDNGSIVTANASGNVGIGTSSPTAKLTVAVVGKQLTLKAYDGSQNNTASLECIRANFSDAASDLAFYTNGGSSESERMRITTAGNVGIGLSNPLFPLTIVRSINDQSSFWSDSGPTFTSNFGNVWSNYQTSTSTHVAAVKLSSASTSTGYITFHTNGASERMRINTSGEVLISCTGLDGDRPNAAGGTLKQLNGNTKVRVSNNDQAGFQFYSPSGGTAFVGMIVVGSASTSYGTTSDYRLKENVAPMTGALAKVSALKPCTYTWKSTGEESQGFIAHELQEVVPDCVTGDKDAVNEDGSIKPQGVDTSFLVATLTAAIQELKATVDAQAARIEALESK